MFTVSNGQIGARHVLNSPRGPRCGSRQFAGSRFSGSRSCPGSQQPFGFSGIRRFLAILRFSGIRRPSGTLRPSASLRLLAILGPSVILRPSAFIFSAILRPSGIPGLPGNPRFLGILRLSGIIIPCRCVTLYLDIFRGLQCGRGLSVPDFLSFSLHVVRGSLYPACNLKFANFYLLLETNVVHAFCLYIGLVESCRNFVEVSVQLYTMLNFIFVGPNCTHFLI